MEKYDFVFILPSSPEHMPSQFCGNSCIRNHKLTRFKYKTVVLGGTNSNKNDSVKFIYKGFEGFPVTNVSDTIPF